MFTFASRRNITFLCSYHYTSMRGHENTYIFKFILNTWWIMPSFLCHHLLSLSSPKRITEICSSFVHLVAKDYKHKINCTFISERYSESHANKYRSTTYYIPQTYKLQLYYRTYNYPHTVILTRIHIGINLTDFRF